VHKVLLVLLVQTQQCQVHKVLLALMGQWVHKVHKVK
jgi:hypothetical protein